MEAAASKNCLYMSIGQLSLDLSAFAAQLIDKHSCLDLNYLSDNKCLIDADQIKLVHSAPSLLSYLFVIFLVSTLLGTQQCII